MYLQPAVDHNSCVNANDVSLSWDMPSQKVGLRLQGSVYQFAGVAPNTVIDPEPVKLEIQRIYTEADAPREEQQTLTFTGANVNGGLTFTLRYNGRDTAPIAFTAAMTTQIKSAIEGLETFYGGTITSISQNGAGNDQQLYSQQTWGCCDITISPSVSWPGTSSVINTEIVKVDL